MIALNPVIHNRSKPGKFSMSEAAGFEFIQVKYLHILDIPSLAIRPGVVTSLLGPSGSGKTSLLRLLNKMASPTSGRIYYNGADLAGIRPVEHRRRVVMMSQTPVIFEGSVRDNLTAGLRFQQKEIPGEDILRNVCGQVRLAQPLDSPSAILSGGEKQRLALGRILLLDPDVYLLDEPASGLDDETADCILDMLVEKTRSQNKTLVMVTHSKAIARRISDNLIHIARGRAASGAAG
ncbi:MAG: ATP-binding cassette domain-containing protein [Dehalococcoidaceae bacterium]|nr:ATP-binding cassette domain-containing protein [Dehalococcoidaceae bacterium]